MIITVVFEDAEDLEFQVDEENGKKLVTEVYVYDDESRLIDSILI